MDAAPRTDRPDQAYRGSRALFIAGFVAFLLSALLMVISDGLFYGRLPLDWSTVLTQLPLVGVVGLPIAWIVMFAVGLPLWAIACERGPLTFVRAAGYGAMAGVIITIVETLGALIFSSNSSTGAYYPWAKHGFDAVCTIGIGAITGLVVRMAAGRSTTVAQQKTMR